MGLKCWEWGLLSPWPLPPSVHCGPWSDAAGGENGQGVAVQPDRPLGWTWRVRKSPRQLLGNGTQKTVWAQKSVDIMGLAQKNGLSLEWIQLRNGKVMGARWMHTRGWWSWCGGICQHSAGHRGGFSGGMRVSVKGTWKEQGM